MNKDSEISNKISSHTKTMSLFVGGFWGCGECSLTER